MKKGKKLPFKATEKTELRMVSIPWSSDRWCRHKTSIHWHATRYDRGPFVFEGIRLVCDKCGTQWEGIPEEGESYYDVWGEEIKLPKGGAL